MPRIRAASRRCKASGLDPHDQKNPHDPSDKDAGKLEKHGCLAKEILTRAYQPPACDLWSYGVVAWPGSDLLP